MKVRIQIHDNPCSLRTNLINVHNNNFTRLLCTFRWPIHIMLMPCAITAKHKKVIYGDVRSIMMEANMKEFFGIRLKKIVYEENDYLIETMVPKDLGVEQDYSSCRFNDFID